VDLLVKVRDASTTGDCHPLESDFGTAAPDVGDLGPAGKLSEHSFFIVLLVLRLLVLHLSFISQPH
jgi:hypothetical protein